MKKLLAVGFSVGILTLGLVGCSSSDTVQQQQQEKILQEATKKTGMPNVHYFSEKELMKYIIEKRDQPKLTTYVYNQTMDGHYVYLGRAVGYGLPYTTQYTNPEKVTEGGHEIPQADPNGLFSGDSEATWIMLVNEQTNEPDVIYMEPSTVVSPYKLPKRLITPWSLPDNY